MMASADVPSLKMERGLSKPNIKFLSNQPYDEVLEIEKDTPAMLSPLTDLAEKTLEDVDDSGKILSDSLSNKSGIPRSTSRPASRPLSRPTPSARVRALGKGELEEVDQNSGDDDEEEDDDDEEEDEDQGIQVEGLFPKTFAARARYASNQTRNRSESSIEKQVQDFKFLSRKMRDKLSPVSPTSLWTENLSLSDCSICDDILHETKYDMLEDERDLQYLDLPYDHKRAYDPADFEHLTVSSEMKELFQYITRYTPQTIELDHKLRPFIPEFIPAVGDIDAFIKVPRPDDEPDKFGLIALDEPCAKQSDPTVLDLQLRAISKETTYKAMAVKSLENADKKPKEVDAWINSIANLHRSKPPPTVHYSKNMPDIETLMQEWPPEFEEKLNEVGLPSADLDCSLEEYVEIVCGILDIPVYKSKVQSLHVLFTLYSEFKNSQHFKSLAMNNELDNSMKTGNPNEQTDHLVIRD